MQANCTDRIEVGSRNMIVSQTLLFLVNVAQSAILAAAVVLNGWLLAVSRGVVGSFKYSLCYLALCDLLFAVVKLLHLHLHIVVFGEVHTSLCRVLNVAIESSASAMFCALVVTPLQRNLVFLNNRYSVHANRPCSIGAVCLLSFVAAWSGPLLTAIVPPGDHCWNSVNCGGTRICTNGGLQWLTSVPVGIAYPTAIIETVLLLRQYRRLAAATIINGSPVSAGQLLRDRQFLTAVTVQTANPMLLSAPFLLYLAITGGGVDVSNKIRSVDEVLFLNMVQAIVVTVILLNPLLDAVGTIYFVKVYRKLMEELIRKLKSSVCAVFATKKQQPLTQPGNNIAVRPKPQLLAVD